jgi:hypothetical protein
MIGRVNARAVIPTIIELQSGGCDLDPASDWSVP